MSAKTFALAAAVAAVAAYAGVRYLARSRLPAHLLGLPAVYDKELLSPAVGDELMALVKQLGDYYTVSADLAFYDTKHEHIGEAQPIVNGSCSHPFLTPSIKRDLCVLPGRIDVGRTFIMTGGPDALKESYDRLVTRAQSFSRYHFNTTEFAVIDRLFAAPRFQQLARAVCPPNQQVLDPLQFNFIVNLPGQTVASHIDAPYFFGADRFHIPQWLLAVMVFSGLFQEQFINQVQVVAYLHRWEDPTGQRRGRFIYYDDNSGVPKWVPPAPLSGSSVDGSKVVHAAEVYMPEVQPPKLDKSKKNMLRFRADTDRWELRSGDDLLRTYGNEELRFSVVYRARCFASEEDKARYANQRRSGGPTDEGDMLPLQSILATLKDDLVRRGRSPSRAALDALAPLDLAMKLMDEYIAYPASSSALLPYNYCAAKVLAPAWMGPLFDAVCPQ